MGRVAALLLSLGPAKLGSHYHSNIQSFGLGSDDSGTPNVYVGPPMFTLARANGWGYIIG